MIDCGVARASDTLTFDSHSIASIFLISCDIFSVSDINNAARREIRTSIDSRWVQWISIHINRIVLYEVWASVFNSSVFRRATHLATLNTIKIRKTHYNCQWRRALTNIQTLINTKSKSIAIVQTNINCCLPRTTHAHGLSDSHAHHAIYMRSTTVCDSILLHQNRNKKLKIIIINLR